MSRRFVPSSAKLATEAVDREASYTTYLDQSSAFPEANAFAAAQKRKVPSRLKGLKLDPLPRAFLDGVQTSGSSPCPPQQENWSASAAAQNSTFVTFSDIIRSASVIENPMNDDNDATSKPSIVRASSSVGLGEIRHVLPSASPLTHSLPLAQTFHLRTPTKRAIRSMSSILLTSSHHVRPRNVMTETAMWGKTQYLDEIEAYSPPADIPFQVSEADLNSGNGRRWVRPGDSVATRVAKNYGAMRSLRLRNTLKATVSHLGDMLQQEMSYRVRNGSSSDDDDDRREVESDVIDNEEFSDCVDGILDRRLARIAEVGEQKYSTMATRYYAIAMRNRQRDTAMREQFIINIERTTFELEAVLTYNDFIVVYRQFNKYTHGGPNLFHSRMPKNGWYFVDHNIRNLLARKIDKMKRGFLILPDLLKHLFPAMSITEITEILPVYEARYLSFSDKKVVMCLDSISVDKVNHFGSVFSIIDKLGVGKVSREEFTQNMPIDESSRDDPDEVRYFLGLIFDKNCRYDINDKLERVGEPYMDLDCLGRALNTEKINDYSGSLVL